MEYIKYVLSVRGMRCGECEAHLEDVIRKNFDIKKVKANRHKKEIVIYAKAPFDETLLKDVLDQTGYPYLGIISKEIVNKRFLF